MAVHFLPDLSSPYIVAVSTDVPPLFALLALMLAGVVAVSLMLLRFRQSLLVGYFACGIVIANSGILGQLGDPVELEARLQQMAEFGIVLLMFTMGLEFSLRELRYLRRAAFLGGSLQLLSIGLPVFGVAIAFGLDLSAAVIVAFALAISSTAVGLKLFQDLGLSSNPGARLALGILIFQDLVAVALVVIMPLLFSGGTEQTLAAMGSLAGKSVVFLAIAAFLGRFVIPRLLHAVVRQSSRELFTLSVFGLCVGIAWLGGILQLSLPMGAFVAGVTVSESIFRHRIQAEIQPFKDVFLALFFVTIGLAVDVPTLLTVGWQVLLLTTGLIIFKCAAVVAIGIRLGWPPRSSVLGALGVCSAGEFSLVILKRAGEFESWSPVSTQILIGSIALSMGLLPFLARFHDPLCRVLAKARLTSTRHPTKSQAQHPPDRLKQLRDHAIICGYGPVGQELVSALDTIGVESLIVELNADTIRSLYSEGRSALFADATDQETWALAGVEHARLVAFTFADAPIVAAALPLIHHLRRDITVLARARFAPDLRRLRALGANVVIHDEKEAGQAVVEHVLAIYDIRPEAHLDD